MYYCGTQCYAVSVSELTKSFVNVREDCKKLHGGNPQKFSTCTNITAQELSDAINQYTWQLAQYIDPRQETSIPKLLDARKCITGRLGDEPKDAADVVKDAATVLRSAIQLAIVLLDQLEVRKDLAIYQEINTRLRNLYDLIASLQEKVEKNERQTVAPPVSRDSYRRY
jgi:hypothetical protein